MAVNPYTLVFGREPEEMISRIAPEEEILEDFRSEKPANQIYLITGVRGVGKTVFMTSISNQLKKEDWICVELNPERDMLTSLASKLCSRDWLAQLFQSARINLSFWGFGLEVNGVAPITDIETALERMMETIRRNNRRLLITIDEVSNTPLMRTFVSAFQIFMRQDLPIYLLMTGLHEKINELKDAENLTFLYRAPQLQLMPLSIGAIANNYQQNFHKTQEEALKMAYITNGYSFAFQLLGYLTWKREGDYQACLAEYGQQLEEKVYGKIWSGLSGNDQKICRAIAKSKEGKAAEIIELSEINPNAWGPYRARLLQKGIVEASTYGHVSFVLPMFREFVLTRVFV